LNYPPTSVGGISLPFGSYKTKDATGLSRGVSRWSATPMSQAERLGCHGLAPWRFTLVRYTSSKKM